MDCKNQLWIEHPLKSWIPYRELDVELISRCSQRWGQNMKGVNCVNNKHGDNIPWITWLRLSNLRCVEEKTKTHMPLQTCQVKKEKNINLWNQHFPKMWILVQTWDSEGPPLGWGPRNINEDKQGFREGQCRMVGRDAAQCMHTCGYICIYVPYCNLYIYVSPQFTNIYTLNIYR